MGLRGCRPGSRLHEAAVITFRARARERKREREREREGKREREREIGHSFAFRIPIDSVEFEIPTIFFLKVLVT